MSSKIDPVNRPLLTGWTKLALVAAGVIVYQVGVYCLVVYHPGGVLGESLMAAPLLVVAWCVLARTRRGRAVLGLLAVAGILGMLHWRASEAITPWLYPVPYLAVYLGLLWLFGRTLRAGQQALITQLATHVHGEISVPMARYTRRVTLAWCVFFAAMALVSLLLFLFEPLPVWSVFNSLLNLPLVVIMYLGEYAWRTWRYPDFPHASIATVFRAFRDFDFSRHAPGR
jgi:uncharacterized membrane protein